PVFHPAELWKETGRWSEIGDEMGRFKDRNKRDMVMGMTHEEVVTSLVRSEIRSYRQLPKLIYQIQTKWRDDPRPRAGLIRVREFTMKDSYSLDSDWEGLDKQYRAHYQAYYNIFNKCDLSCVAVKSDVGMMGGPMAHEFMYLTPVGEDTLLICDSCGYSANRQVAQFKKPVPDSEILSNIEKVSTPGTKNIESLAKYLNIPRSKTAKAVFMMASLTGGAEKDQLVLAMVRGDMEVNETKLVNIIGAKELRPATDEEIRASGAVPGYASPIGLKNILVVVDDLIPLTPNMVTGANQEDYHLWNVNFKRDFDAAKIADITAAQDGDTCIRCSASLKSVRGVELGNIFKLGTRYSEPMNARFLDKDGQKKPVIMGSYGIGSGRLLSCIAEGHYDEKGLMWPINVAPFHVHLVVISGSDKNTDVENTAENIYNDLNTAGVEVLYDDRSETPGVKFND
ncbi:MAG: proline--tRNA ligase, partial [Candidatus Schekmanbacteria bacterium RBG_13_48_7]